MRTAKPQAGVMLIEALIGILVFSIGILALLGMQGTAMKNTLDARFRSEASYLATQIVGEMWINDKEGLLNFDTSKGPAFFPPRDNWVNKVAATLPGNIPPVITVGPNPGEGLVDREVRVRVQWLHPGADKDEAPRQIVMLNRIMHWDTP